MRPEQVRDARELALPVERIRQVDIEAVERFGMHSLVLMENAALGCVNWIEQRLPDESRQRHVWLLCGKGNNGGDGFAIARHLALNGWRCEILCAAEPERMSEDARRNFEIVRSVGGDPSTRFWSHADQLLELESPHLILDCMLGTGASGPIRPPFDGWLEIVRRVCSAAGERATPLKVAVDVPTGIDAETGSSSQRFEADVTLTFVAHKPAMLLEGAGEIFGEVHVVSIGIPRQQLRELFEEADNERGSKANK